MTEHFPPILRPQRSHSHPHPQLNIPDKRTSFDSTTAVTNEKSSLDLTQRLERKLAKFNASDNIFKRWILEITFWTISALCLGAIVVIYSQVNGQGKSPRNEELLAWVNSLGKIAAAALIMPTSEALGQLKWNWFHQSRAMWDFEIFDKASRGPWGAVMLLFRTRGRSLAAFGALLIILLLAIDTFLQQVIEYPDRWQTLTTPGAIPRVIHYRPYTRPQFFQHEEQLMYNMELRPVVVGYFTGNGSDPVPFGNGTRPDIPLSCPTSNCTWPEYNTLAVCSRCEEVSEILNASYTCLNTTIDWSADWTGPITENPYPKGELCGYFLNATETPIFLSGYTVDASNKNETTGEALLVRTIPLTDFDNKQPLYGQGSISFKTVRNPLLDVLVSSAVNGVDGIYRDEAPTIHECILSWCVQTISSSYAWGIYSEDIVSEYWDNTSDLIPWPWQAWEADTGLELNYASNISLQPSLSGPIFGVDNVTVQEVMTIFDDFFPSFYTTRNKSATARFRYKNYPSGPWTHQLDFNP